MIDSNLVKETLNELLALHEKDERIFYKSYISLPIELYKEIERLSVSKSTLYGELCKKAKTVADNFHRSIL